VLQKYHILEKILPQQLINACQISERPYFNGDANLGTASLREI